MEVLGRRKQSVMSLAASATTPTAFASLEGNGVVTLWDTRLRRKDYMCVGEGVIANGVDAVELLFVSDRHMAIVLAEQSVVVYDTRKQALLNSYNHSCEVVAFLDGVPAPGTVTTLIADENGAIIPFDMRECSPTTYFSEQYLGVERTLLAPSFGSLSNYCCGLGLLRHNSVRALCAVGMDGSGAFYTDPLNEPMCFSIMDDLSGLSGQIVNPPLPTACSFLEEFVAIGRGNGMYSVAQLDCDGDFVPDFFAAPGHMSNGLCVVSWTAEGRLVTCSLCGELSLWDLMPLLRQEPLVDETEGDLPPLEIAFSVRESTGQRSLVNCGTLLGSGAFVVGDNMGFLSFCSLELG